MKKPPNKSRGYSQLIMFQFRTFERITKILIIIQLVVISNSCTCEGLYSRLERKCPITKDTLTIHDTLITKEVSRDTVFKYFQRDTVIVREGKLTVKYFYNTHDSTVYLQGKCASDTVIKTIKVPYEKIKVETQYLSWQVKWAILLIALVLLILVIRRSVRG